MSYTEREREILDSWPTVTAQDLTAMNNLFPHYLFFRRDGDLMGLGGIMLRTQGGSSLPHTDPGSGALDPDGPRA
jgi:hypothetical protein